MSLAGVEHVHLIFYAKASPVAKDLVDSIDGRNHTSDVTRTLRTRVFNLGQGPVKLGFIKINLPQRDLLIIPKYNGNGNSPTQIKLRLLGLSLLAIESQHWTFTPILFSSHALGN